MNKPEVIKLVNAGHWAEAQSVLEKLCGRNPDDVEYWYLLGVVHARLGADAEAVSCQRRAVELRDDYTQAHLALAHGLHRQGDHHNALNSVERALSHRPNYLEAWYLQGLLLEKTDRHEQAVESYSRCLAINPGFVPAHYQIGCAMIKCGRATEAVAILRKALELQPGDAMLHNGMGFACLQAGDHAAAKECFREAIRLQPSNPGLYLNMGMAMQEGHALSEAADFYRKALSIKPLEPNACLGLAYCLFAQNKVEEAISVLQNALQKHPTNDMLHSRLVSCLNFRNFSPMEISRAHFDWAQRHASGNTARSFRNTRDSDRCLKIGYVSPDFRSHPIEFFIEPLLDNHDPRHFEIYCYSDVQKPDAATSKLQALARHWRPVQGMSDLTFLELVERDGIDILIDLAGHYSGNRMQAFARRGAPIQISYLGYPNTTGLPDMDYRLTDSVADPAGDNDTLYSEMLYRLPRGFLCYNPPVSAPQVTPLPATQRGYVTFASYNYPAKMSPETIRAWSRALNAVANSKLKLKHAAFDDHAAREHVLSLFLAQGIPAVRLIFKGYSRTLAEHMEEYRDVDLALDTIPYNGTTTTCDALWMGVPVISLAGRSHAGRVGASLLQQVGIADQCLAHDEDEFVAKAVNLANLENLTGLRARLRELMRSSPLCDGPGFARSVETAYRQMWQAYCATNPRITP